MRRAATAVLAMMLLVPGGVVAQDTTTASDDPAEQLTRDEAVALVLATDPRFAALPDYERLRLEATSNFDMGIIFGSDYYRTLPTMPTQFSELGIFDFRYPTNWLIEVTLARECADLDEEAGPSSDTGPWPDPCEWRHSWFHRVHPDGTVTLLFDEGDPPPMPEGDA